MTRLDRLREMPMDTTDAVLLCELCDHAQALADAIRGGNPEWAAVMLAAFDEWNEQP